ncbi:hypothetical protein D4S03_06395 [bacterium]|nr:MAG: hypothetical protein D4S03_06395 [bacterium]
MAIKKKSNSKKSSRQPRYPLKKIRELVDKEQVTINPNASETALSDFGWETDDILAAIKKLQPKDFHKPDPSIYKSDTIIDIYKADNLKGEKVYTHFYIDKETGLLIINSFKRRT